MQDFEETGEAGLGAGKVWLASPQPAKSFAAESQHCQVELQVVLPGDDDGSLADTTEKSTESYVSVMQPSRANSSVVLPSDAGMGAARMRIFFLFEMLKDQGMKES